MTVTSAEPQAFLARHGDTEWSVAHRHTGRTDVPLTEDGRRQAKAVGAALGGRRFVAVFSSPLSRALDTCRLAGFGDVVRVTPDLAEWDYGEYDGLTTPEVREMRPGWNLWDDGAPGGEAAAEVGERVDRVIADVRQAGGNVLVFAHAHVLRVLAARWVGLAADVGRYLVLSTGSISVLGYERETSVIESWNETHHLDAV